MVSFKSKYGKNRSREIVVKFKSNSIYKKETLIVVMVLLIGIGCASTPEEAPPLPAQEIETPQPKIVETELSEKEKQEIHAKIEKLKKPPIKNLMENAKVTKGYESEQTWEAIEEILNRKLLILLKKEFPDSKDVLELPIYNPTGEENYFKLVLKDLFMLYISKNAETGDSITKKNLDLRRNKNEKTVAVFLYPPGARESQEITFKAYNGKLILSSYRSGMEVNPRGYEYVVPEIISMLSLKENGYVPSLKNINQEKVDSIK